MRRSKLFPALSAALGLWSMQACGPGVTLPPSGPVFHEVVATANGLRTAVAADIPDEQFSFFTHSDVFDNDACGDLAIAPDGIMRALAVIRPTGEPRRRELVIRTGVGPSVWSTTFTTAVTPDTGGTQFGNVRQCTPLRMARVRDGLHAIVWTNSDTDSLFNAVYNSDNPQTIAFGRTIRIPVAMQGISPLRMSLAFMNDEVLLTWTGADEARLNTLRGTIDANGIV